MVLAAREGLWIFSRQKGTFAMKANVFKSWAELAHSDGFHSIIGLIGRDHVLGRTTQG